MADEGNKGGEGNGVSKADTDARIAAEVKALLATDSFERVVDKLHRKNHDLERKLGEAEKRIPADGSAVLAGDDLKKWQAYQSIGEPSDLKKAVAERETFRVENEKHARADRIREVADLHYKGKDKVLAKVLDGVDYEIVEQKDKDGKVTGKVAQVKPAKEGDKPTLLADWIKAHQPDFLPALAATPAETPAETPARPANGPPARKVFGGNPPPATGQTSISGGKILANL